MPSSNKTANLNLNQWAETDKPTRADFVSDNSIIDNVVSGHTSDSSIHLNAVEKLRVSSPYLIKLIQGTGESSRAVSLEFVPQMVICFALELSPIELSSGKVTVNWGIGVRNYGGSGGCEVSDSAVVITQGTQGGVNYNLNNSDVQYVVVAFR